jgi:hypothetical protein
MRFFLHRAFLNSKYEDFACRLRGASSLERKTPEISADGVMKCKMRRFMVILLVVGSALKRHSRRP